MYHVCTCVVNKCADQLCGHHAADLLHCTLVLHMCTKSRFSLDAALLMDQRVVSLVPVGFMAFVVIL